MTKQPMIFCQKPKSLEEEIVDYINRHFHLRSDETLEVGNDPLTTFDFEDAARHFAQWGAEHLRDTTKKIDAFTHHEFNESLEQAVDAQMEDEQVVDDYVRRGIDDIVLRYARLGAKWQKEQMMKKAIEWIEWNNDNGGCLFDGWQDDFIKTMED